MKCHAENERKKRIDENRDASRDYVVQAEDETRVSGERFMRDDLMTGECVGADFVVGVERDEGKGSLGEQR